MSKAILETRERLSPFCIKQAIEQFNRLGGLTVKFERVPKVSMKFSKEYDAFYIEIGPKCKHTIQ